MLQDVMRLMVKKYMLKQYIKIQKIIFLEDFYMIKKILRTIIRSTLYIF